MKHPEIACIDEGHYLHVRCGSSIMLRADFDDVYDDDNDGWECIGCHAWFPRMPEMQREGLEALRYLDGAPPEFRDLNPAPAVAL